MEWLTESVRVTAFVPTAELREVASWWAAATGSESEERTTKAVPPRLRESGSVSDDVSLVMDYQAGRVDWLLVPKIDQTEPLDAFPNIGSMEQRVAQLKAVVSAWISKASPVVTRLAVGAVVIKTAASRVEGYKTLQPYLPAVSLDADNSSDFSYSINRPRTSATPGPALKVNRLSRWGVVRLEFFAIAPGLSLTTAHDGGGLYGARLEVDINSAPDVSKPTDALPSERLPLLMDEFFALSFEVMTNGDLP